MGTAADGKQPLFAAALMRPPARMFAEFFSFLQQSALPDQALIENAAALMSKFGESMLGILSFSANISLLFWFKSSAQTPLFHAFT